MKFKYTILSFIIGKNYERVHEIKNKQDDVEYLLITDDPELESNTWTVIIDRDLEQYKSPFERCFRIRYNVFKYASTDICITIDGSMEIKGSLDKRIDTFNAGNYDICLMPHPIWSDIRTEYSAWIKLRGYPVYRANDALNLMAVTKYDFAYQGLYQLCFSIKRKSALTGKIDSLVFSLLKLLDRNGEFERLDQTVFSYALNTWFSNIKVLPVSEQIVRSYAIQGYWHNSDRPNMNVFYDITKPDIKYVFNKQMECLYI